MLVVDKFREEDFRSEDLWFLKGMFDIVGELKEGQFGLYLSY